MYKSDALSFFRLRRQLFSEHRADLARLKSMLAAASDDFDMLRADELENELLTAAAERYSGSGVEAMADLISAVERSILFADLDGGRK